MQELVTGMTASMDRLHSRISDLLTMEGRGDDSAGQRREVAPLESTNMSQVGVTHLILLMNLRKTR